MAEKPTDFMVMEQMPHMTHEPGFWRGMSKRVRIRFVLGLVFVMVAGAVLHASPIAGIVLLMLPLLWSVLVTWFGSESGRGYGPYSQPRETATAHTLRYLWRASGVTRWLLSFALAAIVVGGLGWISTEKMRADAVEPSLTERAASAADRASEATKETARGWMSTAKSWFTSDDAEE
jgi:hypothetical protein